MAIRHAWHKVQGNDGKARITVPIERLEVERPVPSDDTGGMPAAVAVLERHASRLEGEIAAVRARLGAVENERDVERAKAEQVAVLEAVLDLERTRLAEARREAD